MAGRPVQGGQVTGEDMLGWPCMCAKVFNVQAWERQGARVAMPGWKATELCVQKRYSDLHVWDRQDGQGWSVQSGQVGRVRVQKVLWLFSIHV